MVSSIGSADALSQLLSQWSIGSSSTSSSGTAATDVASTASTSTLTTANVSALSESDLVTAFQQLDQSLRATLVQAQSDSGPGGPGGAPDFSQLYSQLTGGSGDLTETEFISGRPPGMSASQADSLWSQIDSSGASSLSESQFVSAMQSLGPQGSSSAASSTGGADATASTSGSATSTGASASDAQLSSAVGSFVQDLSAVTGVSVDSSATSSDSSTGGVTATAQTVLQDIQAALVSYQSATSSLASALAAGSGLSVSA